MRRFCNNVAIFSWNAYLYSNSCAVFIDVDENQFAKGQHWKERIGEKIDEILSYSGEDDDINNNVANYYYRSVCFPIIWLMKQIIIIKNNEFQ